MMKADELKKIIKSGKLNGIFLLYGEEQHLLLERVDAMVKKLVPSGTEAFNLFKFDGKETTAADVLAAVDQFPQMSDMKIITVRESGMLNNANETNFKLIRELSEHFPADTCLVFIERSFDKKKLNNVSFIEKNGGGIVNFEPIPVNQLSIWLYDKFQSQGRQISDRDIIYLITICNQSYGKLCEEFKKLIDYTEGKNTITREDIDAIVEKSTEYTIYQFCDSIIAKNKKAAFEQLKYLKYSKEYSDASFVLNQMMTRLYEILMCKQLNEEQLTYDEIRKYFERSVKTFVISKNIREGKSFDEEYLKKVIFKGLDYDYKIKQGLIDGWIATEMYLSELLA